MGHERMYPSRIAFSKAKPSSTADYPMLSGFSSPPPSIACQFLEGEQPEERPKIACTIASDESTAIHSTYCARIGPFLSQLPSGNLASARSAPTLSDDDRPQQTRSPIRVTIGFPMGFLKDAYIPVRPSDRTDWQQDGAPVSAIFD